MKCWMNWIDHLLGVGTSFLQLLKCEDLLVHTRTQQFIHFLFHNKQWQYTRCCRNDDSRCEYFPMLVSPSIFLVWLCWFKKCASEISNISGICFKIVVRVKSQINLEARGSGFDSHEMILRKHPRIRTSCENCTVHSIFRRFLGENGKSLPKWKT